MFFIKNNLSYLIVFLVCVQVQSLVELPTEEDNEIVRTELGVRNTVNRIFTLLNLKRVKNRTKFEQLKAIHNIFASITLQDHDSLKEIARLARTERIDNKTQSFITELNDILNEDNKSYETTDDVYVTSHIGTFIRKLEYLKHKFGLASNDSGLGINRELLKILDSCENSKNDTEAAQAEIGILLSNPNKYWQPETRRIFQGRREKITRYPFMASVQFFRKFQCGGSIIKSDLVITSASCLQLAWNNRFFRENPAFLSVQVGSELYKGGENIPVLEVYFHPNYNPQNLRNNLAIMRLLRVLKFGKKVHKIKKIDFDRSPHSLSPQTPGITIIGWGAKSSSNLLTNVWSNRLSAATLDFYPLRECQEIYSKEFVTYTNFCAGFVSKGGGACNRDVGGPGVAHGKLMGVISFGSPVCGAPDAPTVFTKLGYYTDWIESILELDVPKIRQKTTPKPYTEHLDFDRYRNPVSYGFRITPVTVGEHTVAYERTSKPLEEPVSPNPLNETANNTKFAEPKDEISYSLPSTRGLSHTLKVLREINENDLFKEFISTMFGSKEVKEQLDEVYVADEESNEPKASLTSLTTQNTPRYEMKPTSFEITTKAITHKGYSPDSNENAYTSDKMVTAIDNFDVFEPSTEETSSEERPRPTSLPSVTAIDIAEDEQNIARLISDIDMSNLLSTESVESSSDAEMATKSKKANVVKNIPTTVREPSTLKKQSLLVTPMDMGDSTDYNDDADDDYDDGSADDVINNNSGLSFMSLLDMSSDNKNDRKDNNRGLSIPEESFKDYTFRHNTSNTGILGLFSQNDIVKLLTEALLEAAKGKQVADSVNAPQFATTRTKPTTNYYNNYDRPTFKYNYDYDTS